ncbi:MAG: hypothetical protein KAX65_15945 [Caldilineaceae bacterium]|nr:hypothetical protein [Caldilineaceae bacterium]
MHKIVTILFSLTLVIAVTGTSLAQTAEPAVEPTSSAYVTVDLQAGFALDPFLVSVNGGGDVAASTLDAACTGFVTENPVVVVRWDAEVEGRQAPEEAEIFFYSDGDPTLAVQLPDGSFLCNDDAHDNLLDPQVFIPTPASGEYKIWVGSYDENQLLPGLLVISTSKGINLGNFDPGALIKRTPIGDVAVAPVQAEESAAAEALINTADITPDATLADGDTLTATVTSEGLLPAALFSHDDVVCSGLVSAEPNYIVQLEDDVTNLRVFFEGDADASLVVLSKQTGFACNDEAAAGENANPQIDIAEAAAGLYGVWVGRFDPETAVAGALTLHAGDDVEPELLEPVAPEGN